MGNQTRSLTESGILAAVMVVLAVVGIYVPFLGILAVLLWPLPAAILVVRWGFRWGLMALVVAAALVGMLIEPIVALRLALAFGPVGLALGEWLCRSQSATRIVMVTLAVSIVAKFAGLALVFFMTGIQPFAGQLTVMEESFSQAAAVYESVGMSEAEIEAARVAFTQNLSMVRLLLPLVVVTMGLMDTMVNFLVIGKLLARLGKPVPVLPPFVEWRLPGVFLYLFGFSLIGMYWGSTREIALLYQVSLNLNMAMTLAGLIEGISLYEYVMRHYRWSRLLSTVLLMFIILNSLFMSILVFTGLLDMMFDYRRRYWGEEK